MLARKCDRCGRLYEPECIKIDGEKVNSITTRETHKNENHLFGKKYDLCPNCLEELKGWMESQREELK